MFGNVKITKNADPDKYSYSGYGIGFDYCSFLSIPNFDLGKNVIIFGVDMSSALHIDNKNKDILILGKEPTQRLHNTALTAEADYSIKFSRLQRKFCLSLHYNGSNSFLCGNATKIYQFKTKNSEIKYPLCLENISKGFTFNNIRKTGLNEYVYEFSVDYNVIDTSNIINIYKYLMKKYDGYNDTKCVLLINQKCQIQARLINLHPNEYSKKFHYYPFAVKLDRCVGNYNTLNDLSNKVFVPNKTEDLNLSVFNMITGVTESKKH